MWFSKRTKNTTIGARWLPLAAALLCSIPVISCSSEDGTKACSPANAFQGSYSGTWGTTTSQYGTWGAKVDTCGNVSGTGQQGSSAFTISGTANSSGSVTFGATQADGTKTATFTGTIATDGSVQGTWITVDGTLNGTFLGTRG